MLKPGGEEEISMVRKMRTESDVVSHTFNPSTQEAEAGKSLSSTEPVPGKTLIQNVKAKNKQKNLMHESMESIQS